ncbi:hypothetical protein AYO45_04485 [Gammaproteobacteria bacterium SCGC AG-212-F23]|nr:hypothetical protein AYO45_04485 [Gammaproteobacteria bacterium SCGC AG-212-F23]
MLSSILGLFKSTEKSPVQSIKTIKVCDAVYIPITGTAEGLFQTNKIDNPISAANSENIRMIDKIIQDLADNKMTVPVYYTKTDAIKETKASAFFLIKYEISENDFLSLKKKGGIKFPEDKIQSLTYYTANNKQGIAYDMKTGQPKPVLTGQKKAPK